MWQLWYFNHLIGVYATISEAAAARDGLADTLMGPALRLVPLRQ